MAPPFYTGRQSTPGVLIQEPKSNHMQSAIMTGVPAML